MDFVESFKHSSRLMNPNFPIKKLLLKLSHKLQKNIILLGFRPIRTNPFVNCPHTNTKAQRQCSIPYYIFQNYLYSLLPTTINSQIVFCLDQQNVYLVTDTSSLTPILINKASFHTVTLDNEVLSKYDIFKILHQPNTVSFKSTFVLYSSFEFINRLKSTKQQSNHIIGHHKGESAHVHHLLLTPHLNTFEFSFSHLDITNSMPACVNLQNNVSISHIPEGVKINSENLFKAKQEEMLDEQYCICQHPDTQFTVIDAPRQYVPLGK